MQIEPGALQQQDVYKILIGSIVPRPIAWVSTIDANGARNLAPFSFFNAVGSSPPALSVSINNVSRPEGAKDTLRNILNTGEFVVNIVSEELAAAMNTTATDFPAVTDEFAVANLEAAPSVLVRPPRVSASPASFECRLIAHVPVGDGPGGSTLVIAEIVQIHVRDDLIDDRYRINLAALKPVARLAGADYAYVHETFSLKRGRYNRETGSVEYP